MADKYDAPPDDQPENEQELVRTWLEALALSKDEEKEWMDTADRACVAYRGGVAESSMDCNLNTFNLFHANVETLVPALYNSTPIPDVRRRFNDDDPVAKEVSELYERSLSYLTDQYDFDASMLSSVRDMSITSRGIQRVRYEPYFGSDNNVSYELTTCEYVPWKSFRRGPAKIWRDVPWVAFELYLSYSEVEKLLEDEPKKAETLKEMKFSYTAEPKKNSEQQGENLSKLAARARVWEIWDKDNRVVHFICPDYSERRLTKLDDPLGLKEFFPIPRPLAAIQAPDSLVPITLLQIYEKLLEELNVVQRRIMSLTDQLRARGWYAGLNATDIESAASAPDGELTPLTGVEAMMANGTGIDKAITYWPLDPIVAALQGLVQQRELIKQTIYEVTGLSDIVRGASDARETATAQQLKSQWGSLRIQRMQAECARFARDLFRLKSEIMAKKFSFDTILQMAGQSYPTMMEKQQAQQHLMIAQQSQQPPDPKIAELLKKPTREEVEKAFRDPTTHRIDIETDSTVRGDVQRHQEQMSLFLQGSAQFMQGLTPLIELGVSLEAPIQIYAGFARSFRLGKQAEDAIDRLAEQVKAQAGQPKQPSAEEQKVKADMQMKQQDMQLQQQKMQHDMQMAQLELQVKEKELQLKAQEIQMKMELENQKAQNDLQIKQMEAEFDMQIKQREADQKAQISAQEAELKQQTALEAHGQKMQMDAQQMQMKQQQGEMDFQVSQQQKQAAFGADEARKAEAHKVKTAHEMKTHEKIAGEGAKEARKAGTQPRKIKGKYNGKAVELEVA